VGFATAVVAGAVLSLVRRDRTRVASDIGGMIGRFTLPALGLRLMVTHRERLAAARPCVYVANHQSFVDYPVLGSIFPPRTVVLGRANLRRMPLIGWLYRATGNLLVDRADPASRRAAIEQMIDAVRGGTSVWVFPEGTRNAGAPGTLLAFRRGAFHVAAATGAPVVPVVVEPLRPRTDLRARRLAPRTLRVEVLEPIHAQGLDADAVARDAQDRMAAALRRIGATQE
jgi:1-acyl-sn-glycerol-3-phosphate acyltransferase